MTGMLTVHTCPFMHDIDSFHERGTRATYASVESRYVSKEVIMIEDHRSVRAVCRERPGGACGVITCVN